MAGGVTTHDDCLLSSTLTPPFELHARRKVPERAPPSHFLGRRVKPGAAANGISPPPPPLWEGVRAQVGRGRARLEGSWVGGAAHRTGALGGLHTKATSPPQSQTTEQPPSGLSRTRQRPHTRTQAQAGSTLVPAARLAPAATEVGRRRRRREAAFLRGPGASAHQLCPHAPSCKLCRHAGETQRGGHTYGWRRSPLAGTLTSWPPPHPAPPPAWKREEAIRTRGQILRGEWPVTSPQLQLLCRTSSK